MGMRTKTVPLSREYEETRWCKTANLGPPTCLPRLQRITTLIVKLLLLLIVAEHKVESKGYDFIHYKRFELICIIIIYVD